MILQNNWPRQTYCYVDWSAPYLTLIPLVNTYIVKTNSTDIMRKKQGHRDVKAQTANKPGTGIATKGPGTGKKRTNQAQTKQRKT